MAVSIVDFGTTRTGEPVQKAILTNGRITVGVISFGATLTEIVVPDKNGNPVDVCLGFGSVLGYETQGGSLGAVVGRFANRIAGASFTVDGVTTSIAPNEGPNLLHGGKPHFGHKVYRLEQTGESEVCFSRRSPDGENGFPGNLDLKVYYSLTDTGVTLHYQAVCDKATALNLTNHAYFNLNGHGSGSAMDHTLTLAADRYTLVREGNIPTGRLLPVAGTALDFTTLHTVGERLHDPMLDASRGYDQNYVLNGSGMRTVARLTGPKTGIWMDTATNQPGLQLYTANYLEPDMPAKDGVIYHPWDAVCLETQQFPDCPNHPEWVAEFGDPFLHPGQTFDRTTVYTFGTV